MNEYTFLFSEKEPFIHKSGQLKVTHGMYPYLIPTIFNTNPEHFQKSTASHYVTDDHNEAKDIATKLMAHPTKYVVIKTSLIEGKEIGQVVLTAENRVTNIIGDFLIRSIADFSEKPVQQSNLEYTRWDA